MPAPGITHLCPKTGGEDQRSEVCDLVLKGSCNLLETEGQLHLLGGRVLLQGADDLREGHVRREAGPGGAAQVSPPRGDCPYLVVVLLGVLVELVQGHERVQGVCVSLGGGGWGEEAA